MQFTDGFLNELRDRLPISQVVGRYVSWDGKKSQPARGDYWACCPFHNEKTPSFHADDRRGRYKCFGCGASGDVIRFMTEKAGLSFPEAVEQLAHEAGLALPAVDPQRAERDKIRLSLYQVLEMSARFFADNLQGPTGARCRGYIQERDIAPDLVEQFRLGYAPGTRNALKNHLASAGVSADHMRATGLVVDGPDIAVSYDRYRDRLIFPIFDLRGRVIAFGGRALSADVPAKYINSPETDLFHKSKVLFNLANARQAIYDGAPLVVCEGYLDVIAAVGAGLKGTVAPLGTSLTADQLALMWRFSDAPVLCFDGDEAGQKAASRAADMALTMLSAGKTVTFCLLPSGLDPDDLIRQHGGNAFADLIAKPLSLHDMIWFREAQSRAFETPEQRAALEARMRAIAATIPDGAVRRHYTQAFKERLDQFFGAKFPPRYGSKPGHRHKGAATQARRPSFPVSPALNNSPLVRRDGTYSSRTITARDAVLLLSVINHPQLLDEHLEAFAAIVFAQAPLQALSEALIDHYSQAGPSADNLRETLALRGFSQVLDDLDKVVRDHRIWQTREEASIDDARVGWLQALDLHQRANALHKELIVAKSAFESETTVGNLARLQDIQGQLHKMQGIEALVEGFGAASGKPDRLF